MPETSTGITTGELARAVGLIRSDIGELTKALAARPDQEDLKRMEDGLVERIRAAAELQALKNALQDKAIAALEGWQVWALRLGGPALVAAVVGVLVNGIRING